LLSISFDLSGFERISESRLTQDDSMQIAHCQIQRDINLRRQRLVQLCNTSSDFEGVAAAGVSEAEPNGQMHVGSLQRIEPHGHRFKKLADRKLLEYVGCRKRARRRERHHAVQ